MDNDRAVATSCLGDEVVSFDNVYKPPFELGRRVHSHTHNIIPHVEVRIGLVFG